MATSRTDRQVDGDAAESAACAHLESAGCRLLARNARFRVGEIDLVMREGDVVVFVEVRLRRDDRFGGALASVDAGKRRRLARAARAWLAANPSLADAPCRFDVVAVGGADGLAVREWLRAAFTIDDLA
jgi:putative endonuclease